MKAGASNPSELRGVDGRARELSETMAKRAAWHDDAARRLTARQCQITELILAGHSSKSIAADLGFSQWTVEHHRAAILKKMESRSLPALARLAFAATGSDAQG